MGIIYLFQQLFTILTNPVTVVILLGATTLGVMIGALPGLSATMGIALLTGLTYKIDSTYAFAVLMGIYVGAIYGGSMSAILLNIPGTASAAATALEGNIMARQGKAELAIKVTRAASIIGTFIGVIALAVIAAPMTSIALKFASAEYFLLAVFGILMCGSIVKADITIKGWIGGMLGILIACVGIDGILSAPRFWFGNTDLIGGIELIPAMIGFYAIPEVIKALNKYDEVLEVRDLSKEKDANLGADGKKQRPFAIAIKNYAAIIKASLIGVGVGALPGVGEDVAAWIAYDTVKKGSKTPELYGTGECYEAIISPEVGNNAAIGGATIPLLTLAVPGSPPAAMLLGAFMVHNIIPGPMLFSTNPDFIFYIAALIFAATIALWVVGMVIARPMTKVLKVPNQYLMPIVSVLSIVGAYAISLNDFDITIVFAFGILGYLFDKMKYATAPIVLGIILGEMIDTYFRRALIASRGDMSVFFTQSWITVLFCIIIAIVLIKNIFPKLQLNPMYYIKKGKKANDGE
ncbi:MAG: tripartite tricarboxylate transporter permease [Bacillota bacterium]